jgi:protein-tyrosine phosphatase
MLLFICHANICRSAMAERLARLALTTTDAAAGGIASAGTHARPGAPMHPGAVRVLRDLGADTGDFASRAVSADLLAQASLVLTATRDQRSFCVRLAPATLRRTFTIRQFGRLAVAVDAAPALRWAGGDAGALLDQIAAVRGGLQPVSPDEDDLADPVNGTEADMRDCARQIQLSLRPALALIGPG